MNNRLTRDQILTPLIARLEPVAHIYAMWEIGAAAFDQLDEYSDLDLMICAEVTKLEEVITLFDESLDEIAPIELRWRVPEPAPYGLPQLFYRIANTSPYMMVDVVFMAPESEFKYLVPEIHNPPKIYFDKSGVVRPEPFYPEDFLAKLKLYVNQLRVRFELFQPLILKELAREQPIEAMGYYQSLCLRPLLELLKIRYSPTRYNFSTRYVYRELPSHIIEHLEPLYFCCDTADLARKSDLAEALFHKIHDSLNWDEIERLINSAVIESRSSSPN